MSSLAYNGVNLPYCFTTNFDQSAVMDDEAGTDWVYTKFDIQAQAVLNSAYLSIIAPSLVGTTQNPADIMNVIRSQLLKPRKTLSFTFNGVNLIPAQTAGPGTVDAKNGPVPQACVITQLTNTTFLITYHIIAHYWENNSLTGSSPAVLNQIGNNVMWNRWTETMDIDNANYTRRTREGKYVIRSDNPAGFIADQLRTQMAVVGVPPGFLRESSSYTQTPDGLAIRYRIVDKEVFKLPPSPAFEAEGEYIETTPYLGGQIRHAEVRVRLRGDKNTDQALLIQTAVGVASSKISANTTSNQEGGDVQTTFNMPESTGIMVKLYENEVEVRMRAMANPSDDKQGKSIADGVWGIDYQGMAFTPGSDGGQGTQPLYLDRGTASLLLQAAAYYDPSLTGVVLDPTGGQLTAGLPVGTAGTTLESGGNGPGGSPQGSNSQTAGQNVTPATVTIGQVQTDNTGAKFNDLSRNSGKNIFTDYHIQSRYEKDKHIYMMGVTSPNGFQGNSVAFVQLASPTLLWIVDWTAAKWGVQPEIPDSGILNDSSWVLLDEIYEPVSVRLGSDGVTPLYRISGTYVYGHPKPQTNTLNNLSFGRPPWIEDSFDRSVPSFSTTPGLIDYPGVTG